MSHPFFTKHLVVLTSPVVFGKASAQAARAVWGGASKPENGIIGPPAPIGTGAPPVVEGPVDPNHPEDPEPDQSNQTPVQTVERGENPNSSTVLSRNMALTFEIPAGDYGPGTTIGIVIPAWATGDVENNTRSICAPCTVNGQPAGIIFEETIGVTGWYITGLDGIPDGTPLDIQIQGTSQMLAPADFLGNRTSGPATDYTLSLSAIASGGMASGDMSGSITGRWDVHDVANGPSGGGVEMTDGGEPGGVAPGAAAIPVVDAGRATGIKYPIRYYLRMGYPRGRTVIDGGAGGLIIEESYTNWPPPGLSTWEWVDGKAVPQYYFSVGGSITEWYYVGGAADPESPDYTPPDYGEIDTGGPIYSDPEQGFENLPGTLKDGFYEPPPAPAEQPPDPPDNSPVYPDITEPRTVNPPYIPPEDAPAGDELPMEEFPLTKDIVINTTVTGAAPYEDSSSPEGKDVLLDYTGFSFVSGTGFEINETVRFKYLPLKARVEDQPASSHGFYTAVVGPFTGARFREMVDETSARVELFWDGPSQPLILFRKMPERANPLASSTASFEDLNTSEASRDVTINWTVDLPIPFGLGYKFDATSEPGRILLRKMQSAVEPNMETELNITHYNFDTLPQMSWQYEQAYKSRESNGWNVLLWQATIAHTITFENA